MSRRLKPGPEYDPDMPVPAKWKECALEYRHGWSWGGRPNIYNPISLRTPVNADEHDVIPEPRAAWAAGRLDYRRAHPAPAPRPGEVYGLWSEAGNRWLVADSGNRFLTEHRVMAEAVLAKLTRDGATGVTVRALKLAGGQ